MKKDIEKYLNGELGSEESLQVLNTIKNDKDYLDCYIDHKTKKTILELNKKNRESNVLLTYRKFKKEHMLKQKMRYFFATSAALVLIMVGFYFTSKTPDSPTTEIVLAKYESYKSIVLSDGSTVFLSANSKISYNDFSKSATRLVTLEGEALFKVTKNLKKPFIVNANGLDVKVLGTTFNVKALPNAPEIETILFTGKVNLLKNDIVISSLIPNQQANYNIKNGKLTIKNLGNSEQLLDEKEGLLVFENTSLDVVVSQLEKRYHKNFVVKIENIKAYHFTGKFNATQTITEVVSILNATSPIKYSIKDNQVFLENKQ